MKSKFGAWRRDGWWHGGMDCSRALPTAPEIFWWWKSPEEGGWWPKDFEKPKAQLGASHWIKAEMLLIPSKSLPFEPNPGQNQTTCVLRGQDDDISSSGDDISGSSCAYEERSRVCDPCSDFMNKLEKSGESDVAEEHRRLCGPCESYLNNCGGSDNPFFT